jgi:hypothetical protein
MANIKRNLTESISGGLSPKTTLPTTSSPMAAPIPDFQEVMEGRVDQSTRGQSDKPVVAAEINAEKKGAPIPELQTVKPSKQGTGQQSTGGKSNWL